MVIDRIIEYKVHIFVNENLENSSNLRVIL